MEWWNGRVNGHFYKKVEVETFFFFSHLEINDKLKSGETHSG